MSKEKTPTENDDSTSPDPTLMKRTDNAPNTSWQQEQAIIENLLQKYKKSYKQSVKDIRDNQFEIINKAQKTTMAYAEKNEHCNYLIEELNSSQQEVKELTQTLEEVRKKEETMRHKWLELLSRFTGIEKKYDNERHNAKITIEKLNAQLDERTMSVAEYEIELADVRMSKQALLDQLNRNNAAHNNQIQSLETINSALQVENNQLTANVKTLREELAEQIACYKDLALSMQKSMLKTNEQKVEYENAAERYKLELKKAQQIRETLENNIVHMEQDRQKMSKQNQQLSKEIQEMRQRFELQSKEHKAEMESLYSHNQNVTETYMSEEKLYKEKIEALEAEIKKQFDVVTQQEDEITTLVVDYEVIRESKENIQKRTETTIKEEKAKIQKAFEEKEKLMQEKLRDLEKKLICKDNELLNLERLKNATISELKYKMNKIGNVFTKSVGSAAVFHETNEPNLKISKNQTQPVSVEPLKKSEKTLKTRSKSPEWLPSDQEDTTPAPKKRSRPSRSSSARKPVYNVSDFDDETSEDNYIIDLVKSPRKRPKKSLASTKKIDRLDTAVPSDSSSIDIFDKIKSAP
ncbi:uncharacterized protein [Drosophila tropicalis]|uniref:uncharacterized protein isoform X2 n=1 Tax=Drosophila tropicalis TaxID=46794 RepID=UPI0035ABEFA1